MTVRRSSTRAASVVLRRASPRAPTSKASAWRNKRPFWAPSSCRAPRRADGKSDRSTPPPLVPLPMCCASPGGSRVKQSNRSRITTCRACVNCCAGVMRAWGRSSPTCDVGVPMPRCPTPCRHPPRSLDLIGSPRGSRDGTPRVVCWPAAAREARRGPSRCCSARTIGAFNGRTRSTRRSIRRARRWTGIMWRSRWPRPRANAFLAR